jgi:hypothetical protein
MSIKQRIGQKHYPSENAYSKKNQKSNHPIFDLNKLDLPIQVDRNVNF